NIQSISDEIDPETGIVTTDDGIIGTIDKLRVGQFTSANYTYYPGAPGDWGTNLNSAWITTRPINNGEMQDWGNPVAEMMYETLRYFASRGAPTGNYATSASGNTDADLGLPVASWDEPYDVYPACSAGIQTVISGIYPSYDTDSLPGSAFGSFTGDLDGLDVSELGDEIWSSEHGGS